VHTGKTAKKLETRGVEMKKNIGVLLAAGIGARFGSTCPKQFSTLNGREVISYSIDMMKKVGNMDDFIVVVGHEEHISGELDKKYNIRTIEGGDTRGYSFYNALQYIKVHYPDCEKVIFHEAARPLLKPEVMERYFDLCLTAAPLALAPARLILVPGTRTRSPKVVMVTPFSRAR
jgi:2-C-methyl-D-erythritol 4-phosphate cytidylyltransferase